MQFLEKSEPHGHLEIWKHYPDGKKELHFKDDNVICSGMGATLAEMFDADPNVDVENFQCLYFRCGSGGQASYQVSSRSDIESPFNRTQYGNGNLDMSIHNLIQNGAKSGGTMPFGSIPYGYIKRVTPTKCMWQIVLDEQTCNVGDPSPNYPEGYINEIGLYSKNPYVEVTDASMLCAYRYFKKIYKTDAFILVFRWTIEF
tara:strand:- start:5989 stop:6591 length:603 start_codon:yes stop_codon:yes gene_type:complete